MSSQIMEYEGGDQKRLEMYIRRYNRASGVAQLWWPILESAYHYCIPNRNLYYYTNQTQGSQKNIKVFDTTQVAATKSFVSKVHRALTPPQQTWAFFEAGENVSDEEKEEIDKMLQVRTDTLFSYIHASNFDIAINEAYYDLAVGTGVLVVNEGTEDNPLLFSSIPLEQVAIEESINHRVETCFRTWGETRIMDIQSMWPRAKITSTMAQQLKDDPAATIKSFVEACIFSATNTATPYTYCLWNGNDILLEEMHESSEFIIFRWSKINNEVFGRGPIIDALPSIISLQTAAYFEMTAVNLNICKPYMAYSDGVFNPWTFRMAPNTIIPVSPNTNGQFPIQPLPDVANPNFMQLLTVDLRQQINTLMFANPLGDITNTKDKTATEMQLRQNNLAEEIGPIFTRLQQEFLARVVNRCTYILERRGLMEKIIVNGREIKINYKSPLTMSQGQQDVQTFVQYMQVMGQLMGPEISQMYVNTVKYPGWIGRKMGVDATLINTENEVQATLEAKQNEMQAMQVAQAQEAQGAQPG